jgi:hypothetical protein
MSLIVVHESLLIIHNMAVDGMFKSGKNKKNNKNYNKK